MGPDMGSALRAEALSPQTTSRPLRAWQQSALERYEEHSPKDFLVTATPGAGKTTFALTLASRLLSRREVARVVVVCPTDHLRLQWADAADRVGIVLDPGLTNAVGPVRAGTQGYVTTYAQVAGKPMLHAARASAVKTLVILDEVHHAGDGLSWGEAVEEAFGFSARRLCLTGTPFRTKADERIPFVRYEEDSFEGDDGEGGIGLVSRADYTYGYKEALADSVVRPVVFAAYTGHLPLAELRRRGRRRLAVGGRHRSRWRCRPGGPRWTPRASGCRTSSPPWTTGSRTCARTACPTPRG